MEVKVNIIDTLFTTIPKNTVVASYTIDEDSVDLTMLNDQYSFNTTNKTILTSSNVTSNNLKAINFTARNWVSGEQVEINDMYPRVVSKLQNKFNKPNTIYKVTKDLDLNHCVLTIPEGCTLQFDGGSIKNGIVDFNFTTFINPNFSNVRFTGSILNQQLNIDDFGAVKGDESFDNSIVINDLINLKKRDAYAGAKIIYVPSGAYYISNSIQLYDYYNSNITLTGEGLSSVIAQVTDNIPIIKSYETTVISNLRLIYKNWQPVTNTNATAIAVQRAIRSVFENLMIVDAQKGFGYITIADQENDKITTFKDQTYVNANTRNVAIYQCSSYAIDLRKEIAQADSGSTYDNIYISSSHPINGYDENKPSIGAIYMGGSSMTFTQLNIESKYSGTLIMSTSLTNYLTIANLHIEGLTTMRTIYNQVSGQGFFDIGNIDIDRCAFTTNNLFLFYFSVSIKFNIDLITLRSSCTIPEGNQWFIFQQGSGTSYGRLGNHSYPAGMAPTRVNNSYDHIVLRIDRSDFLVTYGSQDQFTTPSKNNWLLYAGGNTLAYLYNKAIYIDDAGDYRYPDGYLARLNGVTIRRSGTTTQRPILNTTFIGFTYYDTTINELLTWSGTGWINPDGTAISRVNFIKTVTDITSLESGDRLLRIVGNIDLNGETLTLPSNCTLDFQGGSFSNGTIIGSNTTILPNGYKIQNVDLKSSFKYPDGVNAVSSDGLCLNNVYDILDKQNLATTEINNYIVKDDDYTILSQFDTLKNVNAVDGSFIGFPTSVIYNNLLYCFYYKANTHESTPGIQENIYYKYSSDKGITWSEEKEWVLPSSDSNGTYRSYRTAYVVPFGSNLLFGIFCTTTTSSAIGGSFTLVCEATISEAHDITILNQIKTPIVGASGSLVYSYTDATITNSMIIGGNIIQVGSNYLMACYTSNRNNYVFSFDGNFTDNTHITQLDVISSEQFDYTEHAFIKFSDTNFYIAFREDARRENTPIFKYDTSTSKFELFTYIDNVAYDGLDAIILDDNTAMIAGRDARNYFTPTRFALMNSSGKVFISNAKYYGDVLGRDCGYCSLQIIEDTLINIFYLKRSQPNYNYGVVSRRIPVKTLTNLIFY